MEAEPAHPATVNAGPADARPVSLPLVLPARRTGGRGSEGRRGCTQRLFRTTHVSYRRCELPALCDISRKASSLLASTKPN